MFIIQQINRILSLRGGVLHDEISTVCNQSESSGEDVHPRRPGRRVVALQRRTNMRQIRSAVPWPPCVRRRMGAAGNKPKRQVHDPPVHHPGPNNRADALALRRQP